MNERDRELAVVAKLADMRAGCAVLLIQLDQLAQLLGSDAELTTDQYAELAATLADVGLVGGMILAADLAKTDRRESVADR